MASIGNPLRSPKTYNKRFTVVYVVKDTENFEFLKFESIRDLCLRESIGLNIRNFNSSKYNEDQEFIERLPAIHIYKKQNYLATYYMNEDPIGSIRSKIKEEFETDLARSKKRLWYRGWGASLRSLFSPPSPRSSTKMLSQG
jgi:hypothetical protein